MTDKAAVEIPAPVSGRVVSHHRASPATWSPSAPNSSHSKPRAPRPQTLQRAPKPRLPAAPAPPPAAPKPQAARLAAPRRRAAATRVMASPATRRKAHVAGVDLASVSGIGPGRAHLRPGPRVRDRGQGQRRREAGGASRARKGVEEIKIIGVRRVIAERMSAAKRNIPHFAYVEEVDVTELEALRQYLNSRQPKGAPSLTYLPFLVAALVRVLESFPQCNAVHDAERNLILRHRRRARRHRDADAGRPQGSGRASTPRRARCTTSPPRSAACPRPRAATRRRATSSWARRSRSRASAGSAASPRRRSSTRPEVAIVGVNKAVERPVVIDGAIAIRRIMNLSSSFDHRFVDGFDAAAMIQALKEKLEHPATIFIQD